MKFILVLLTVCMLSGCGMMEEKMPVPSIIPSSLPSILPSEMPNETATGKPVALGTFQTPILDAEPDRVHNLQLCASTLQGIQIPPGAEFSFNNTVGVRTAEKGYRQASMLVEGKRQKAVGGGVCQISSTLFNAAEMAGMEILERHDHTGEVHYIEIGRDAAVSFGEQDFRFRNPLPVAVTVTLSVENGVVTAVLYRNDTAAL